MGSKVDFTFLCFGRKLILNKSRLQQGRTKALMILELQLMPRKGLK